MLTTRLSVKTAKKETQKTSEKGGLRRRKWKTKER